jgi:hypothetical protein
VNSVQSAQISAAHSAQLNLENLEKEVRRTDRKPMPRTNTVNMQKRLRANNALRQFFGF